MRWPQILYCVAAESWAESPQSIQSPAVEDYEPDLHTRTVTRAG